MRNCNSCKHKDELLKDPQDRDLNCQQCHAAERITGLKYPNYEPVIIPSKEV